MTMRDAALKTREALADPTADPAQIRALTTELIDGTLSLSYMLSEPDWGVGMLEDIDGIIGSDPNPEEERRWARH
jgi:hypothetical protein